jgi:plasmid stability protein
VEHVIKLSLPPDVMEGLRTRAKSRHRTMESEAVALLAEALGLSSASLVDLLSTDEGGDIDFEPRRLGIAGQGHVMGGASGEC